MIEKLSVLFICLHIRIKSIDYDVSIKFYDQSSLTIVCMIYFPLQWKKEIREKLESVRLPAIVGGHSDVYETWIETLSLWLSSNNNEVYMASPFGKKKNKKRQVLEKFSYAKSAIIRHVGNSME